MDERITNSFFLSSFYFPQDLTEKSSSSSSSSSSSTSQGQIRDDGIEVLAVNGNGSFNLPHSRSDCTKHKFNSAEADQYHSSTCSLKDLANAKHCDKCYCYVCDDLASKCIEWRTHCHGE